MAYATRELAASKEDVYQWLIDPWTYPLWLVGANDVRAVDESWPAPGACFHHRVGFGPFTTTDNTELISAEPFERIQLAVRARPLISAVVTFGLVGEVGRCMVSFEEEPRVRTIGNLVRPVLDPITHIRNHHSLKRLEQVVMRRDARPLAGQHPVEVSHV
jgi:hypothetical protein